MEDMGLTAMRDSFIEHAVALGAMDRDMEHDGGRNRKAPR